MANLLNNYVPGLKYGAKILPSEILGGGSTVFGNVYYVDYANGSDDNTGQTPTSAFKTVSKANDTVTTNNTDVVFLAASNTAHTLSEMLTVAKNRVSFIGTDGGGRQYGQGSRVTIGVTTATTDLGAMKNTGVRNNFMNIKFSSNNTVDEGLYTVLDGGEYAVYRNCEFYKSTDLDETGAAEFVMNADSIQMFDCTFGSLADALSGDIVRACVLLTKEIAGTGKVTRDAYLENCRFWRKAGHVNNRFIYAAASADVERGMVLVNPIFINSVLGVANPAQCISAGASLADGYIMAINPSSFDCTKVSTTTGVFVIGPANNAGAGISTQAA